MHIYSFHDLKFTLLHTYSMVQSPSWEANWFATTQEIPHILCNPKVHYRTHKRPPPVPVLGQPNPVHIPTSHLLEIHPNIIHPSTPRSPQWSLSVRFFHQDPIRPPLLTHTRHMPSPSYSSRFYHPHNIGWGVQIIDMSVLLIKLDHRMWPRRFWILLQTGREALQCGRELPTFRRNQQLPSSGQKTEMNGLHAKAQEK